MQQLSRQKPEAYSSQLNVGRLQYKPPFFQQQLSLVRPRQRHTNHKLQVAKDDEELKQINSTLSILQTKEEAIREDNTTHNILGKPFKDIYDQYELLKAIGYGQYGTIRRIKEISTGTRYAVKSIKKQSLKSNLDRKEVRREVQIMEHLNGFTNIVYLKEAFEDSKYVHMVMELCTGGELFDKIVDRGHYSEKSARDIITVILGIVQHCHSLGVMHRDIKPENFLLTSKDQGAILKATDFGLSTFYKHGQILTEVVGSPYYVAPEVLDKHYSNKADIWSCGVVLYVLLSGVPPFWGESDQEVFREIRFGQLDFESAPWPQISDIAKDCIKNMLNRDVQKRPSINEVIYHPFIKEGKNLPDKPLQDVITTRLRSFMEQNKLKKQTLRLISSYMAVNQIAGLKQWFKQIDTNNDGQITVEEFRQSLRIKGHNDIEDIKLEEYIKASDIDKNGKISFEEFIAATVNQKVAITEENILRVFQELDKDKSGFLSIDELEHAIQDYQGDILSHDVEEILKEADKNGDGVIDYKEFSDMMQHKGADEFEAAQRKAIKW